MWSYSNYLLILLMCCILTCKCSEDDWSLYESQFIKHNREEIYISNVTTSEFLPNITVGKWKTLNSGFASYTAGLVNDTKLAVIISTLSNKELKITPKVYDLGEDQVADVELVEQWKDGLPQVYVIAFIPSKGVHWYAVSEEFFLKVWEWNLEDVRQVSSLHSFHMNNEDFLLIVIENEMKEIGALIYSFCVAKSQRRLFQFIPLPHHSPSVCFSPFAKPYLSFTQPTSNTLVLYQLSNGHSFSKSTEIPSAEINQVICFEDIFKSFIAFNGLNATIMEITEDFGTVERKIANSNLNGLQFWLPLKVNRFRDETILMFQRLLDHNTHTSFDVELVTYNGRRFEEHMDIPCQLFEESHKGLECITDFSPLSGIQGSSYIAIEKHLALVVSSAEKGTTIFNLEMGLRKLEHPAKEKLDEFLEREQLIKDSLKELESFTGKPEQISFTQDAPILRTASATRNSNFTDEYPFDLQIEEMAAEIEALNEKLNQIQNHIKEGVFDTVIFNGNVEVQGVLESESFSSTDEEFNTIFDNIARKNELKQLKGEIIFKQPVSVEELYFETLNGVSKDDHLVQNNGIIEVDDVIFDNLVTVDNLVLTENLINDVNVNEWITPTNNNVKGSLKFEEVVTEILTTNLLNNRSIDNASKTGIDIVDEGRNLAIPGNVTVTTINGENFENFLKKLCYKNAKCQIERLHVSGNVNILENIEGLNYLNKLKFPEGYVDLNSNETLLITGEKHFLNTLQADTVTSENINNLDLSKVISLSQERDVKGNLKFDDLEVLSNIRVLDENTNLITEEVYEELEVLGDIIITDNFNEINFDDYLSDFISKDDNASITITGRKTFPQGLMVHKNLKIQSAAINNISLESLITKTTNQDLYLDSITGNMDFDSLTVEGLFDGHNITELDQNLIKLTDTELITSKLVFEDAVSVDTLEVFDEYYEFIEGDVGFDELVADSVEVQGSIEGQVDGVDLDEWLQHKDSQTVVEEIVVHELTCKNLFAELINNVSANQFNYTKIQEIVTDLILYRNATVETLIVNGNLNLKSVNSEDFPQIIENHIWTKINRNSSTVTIDGDVHFKSLQIKHLADVDFNDFVNNLIFTNDSEVNILNSITFLKGITVKNLVESKAINKIELENILRKSAEQTLKGFLHVLGDVTIEDDVTVQGMINNVEVAYLLNNFDVGEELLIVKDEMLLHRLPYIRNLTIKGLVNDQDLDQVFSNLVYLQNKNIQLDQNTLFTNQVHVQGNLITENGINDVNFTEFFSKVALINESVELTGNISFIADADVLDSVNTEVCETNLLFTKKFEEQINRGVLLNKGFLPGIYKFQNMSIVGLSTKFVNDLVMDEVIPLKTPQHLKQLNITKMSVTNDVEVGNLVNGVKLKEEKEKTVLSNVEQTIPGEVVFTEHVLVYDQINIKSINGKPVEKIVTINTDQNLTAVYNFDTKVFVNGNITVAGLINKVNLTEWKEDSLRTNSNETQIVTGDLTVETLDLLGPVEGKIFFNGFNATQLVAEVEEKTANMTDIQKQIMEDFNSLCNQLTNIYAQFGSQFLKFDYFEEFQTIQLLEDINYVKHFKHQDSDYLLINEKKSCLTHLMKLKTNSGYVERDLENRYTGVISQIEVISEHGELFLVARMISNCQEDLNFDVVWKFVDEDLYVVDTLDCQELLQSSLQPLTFYGFRQGVVTEFKVNSTQATVLNEYRKWNISERNATFFPRGLQTGLAVLTDKELFLLHQENVRNVEEYNLHTTSVLIGNFSKEMSKVDLGSDVAVVKAGIKGGLRTFLAVAQQTKSEVGDNQDFIEIYSDPLKGELFQRIPAYQPASPISIEFGNGETLLAFMENSKILQIYEYKGIMGFKHRSSIKIPATSMFLTDLPVGKYSQPRKVLGLIHNNKTTFLQAQMFGRVVPDGLQCSP